MSKVIFLVPFIVGCASTLTLEQVDDIQTATCWELFHTRAEQYRCETISSTYTLNVIRNVEAKKNSKGDSK